MSCKWIYVEMAVSNLDWWHWWVCRVSPVAHSPQRHSRCHLLTRWACVGDHWLALPCRYSELDVLAIHTILYRIRLSHWSWHIDATWGRAPAVRCPAVMQLNTFAALSVSSVWSACLGWWHDCLHRLPLAPCLANVSAHDHIGQLERQKERKSSGWFVSNF